MEDPMIKRAMKHWENVSADPKLRELYFDRRKAVIDRMAADRAAELRTERAEAKGRVEGSTEAICQYLEARFGSESQDLQKTVRIMNDLERLNQIMNRIFTSNTLDEAERVIQIS